MPSFICNVSLHLFVHLLIHNRAGAPLEWKGVYKQADHSDASNTHRIHSHTNGGVNHAGREPARRSSQGEALRDNSTLS